MTKRIGYSEIKSNFYMIVDKDMAKPIGFFGLTKDNELNGLFIEPQYRRKGYATELIEDLRRQDIRIQTITSTKNIPMQKLCEKLGLKKWLKYEDSVR